MRTRDEVVRDMKALRELRVSIAMGMSGSGEELAKAVLADPAAERHHAAARYVLADARRIDETFAKSDDLWKEASEVAAAEAGARP